MHTSPFKGKTGLTRIWNAFHYSLDGLVSAYRYESAFRQELWLGIVMAAVAIVLPVSLVQLALLLGSVLLVLITELLNSAVEAVVDRVSAERHDLAKRAKDMGSAAVFISLANCVIVWGLVLADVFID
jgi:diacylglycerol kinase (ATP)